MGRTRRETVKLIRMAPGMTARAVTANRQFRKNRIVTAMTSRRAASPGEITASCSNPEVVSTSPLRRAMMPPIFSSESFCKGRYRRRS